MATLIGDLVHSRRSEDRGGLHRVVVSTLEEANVALSPLVPLRFTVGDEYQGGFRTVGDAARASLHLRLALASATDVRHGLGWGETRVLQDEPRVEDGPAWWAARDAIHEVEVQQQRAGSRWRRTCFRRAAGADGPDPATLEAMLILRDRAVDGLDERSLQILRGLLEGRSQRELADALDVSPSAVSQRVRADGLAALVASDRALAEAS